MTRTAAGDSQPTPSPQPDADTRLRWRHLLARLTLWGVAVLLPLPLVAAYGSQAVGPLVMRQEVALGIIAYVWWLLAIVLSLRWRWLERRVGLASIYGLHGMLGLAALVLAWLHQRSTYGVDPLGARLGIWAWYLSIATVSLAVFFLSGWIVDHVPGAARLRSWLEHLLPHGLGVWLHRINLVIVVMVLVHAHLLVRLRGGYVGFLLLLDVVTAAVLIAWAWWAWRRRRPRATVVVNEGLNPDLRRLVLAPDAPMSRLEPGDVVFIKVVPRSWGAALARLWRQGTPGDWHPFSVTGADPERLSFLIRQLGDFTRSLSELPVGARVAMQGPYGRFGRIAEAGGDRPLVLVGMGAGNAPLLSMIETYARRRPVHLLWSVRPVDREAATALVAPYRDDARVTVQERRFTEDDLTRILQDRETALGQFFIVGPPRAVIAMRRTLHRVGVPRAHLHDERLTM
ncbi:ferric reductase [Actinomyces sp. ZJ308]|uniref:ferric reductase n=1 Tax=Actinomyces sp. ZJ308 TaxID=2708342 RepID=UPI00142089FC|nr:ferric reductase [Actinomyces sp. ZJ308]